MNGQLLDMNGREEIMISYDQEDF